MFHNLNLSNLEKVLQRNLRTGRAKECSFRASEGTNFENFSLGVNHGDTFVDLMYILVHTKNLV